MQFSKKKVIEESSISLTMKTEKKWGYCGRYLHLLRGWGNPALFFTDPVGFQLLRAMTLISKRHN
jgi:hypothetical protein